MRKFHTVDPLELRPCPFCGRRISVGFWTISAIYERPLDIDDGAIAVVCASKPYGRGASGPFDETEELAAQAWNRRA